MKRLDAIGAIVGGLVLAILVIYVYQPNDEVSKIQAEQSAPLDSSDRRVATVTQALPGSEASVERFAELRDVIERQASELDAGQERIDALEEALLKMEEKIEVLARMDRHHSLLLPDEASEELAPSARYSHQIQVALMQADDVLQAPTFNSDAQLAAIDELIRLYQVRGLSGEQNSFLKSAFRDLVDQRIEYTRSLIVRPEDADLDSELDRLRSIAAMRIDNRSWITQAQRQKIGDLLKLARRLQGQGFH